MRNPHIKARRRALALALWMPLALYGTGAAAQEGLRVTGTGSGTGGMQLLMEAFLRANPGVQGEVLPALGSSGGIRALIDGKIELAVSNRAPNAKDAALAPTQSFVYARTAVEMTVHKDVGVTSLTSDELAGLYADGGASFPTGRRARPVLRFSDALDMGIVKSFSPAVAAAIDAASSRHGLLDGATDSDTADLIERTPGAFEPSTLALIESEKRSLRVLANGQWKHQKPLIMVMPEKPGALAQRFVAYVKSAEGRRMSAPTEFLTHPADPILTRGWTPTA